MSTPCIPVSWGELIDKITILEIKSERLRDASALDNVRRELTLLRGHAAEALQNDSAMAAEMRALRVVNEALWDIEERIRRKEIDKSFDDEFVALARSVYQRNDERSHIKRLINLHVGSELIEEKSYDSL